MRVLWLLLLLPPIPCFGRVSSTVDMLQSWCMEDSRCVSEYFLDTEPDLFKHMVSSPLIEAAEHAENTPTGRELWVARLRLARMDVGPTCNVYEVPTYYPDTKTVECACMPESPCGEASTDPTLMYVVITLIVIIVIGILGLAISYVVTMQSVAGRASKATAIQTRRMLLRVLGT